VENIPGGFIIFAEIIIFPNTTYGGFWVAVFDFQTEKKV